jgi:4-hydroxy-tetrahydrodipicolinate reductase
MAIRVLVNGANGKMGRVTVDAIQECNDLELADAIGRENNLAGSILENKADVVVDFTLPDVVFDNAKTIIKTGARPVIGTSGLNEEQIDELTKLCEENKLGGIIAPNFSLGAVLMMKYAQDAAKYFQHAEIIEMHHEKKVDAPSGTAVKTAQMMAKVRETIDAIPVNAPARSEAHTDIPIHSVRLPGLFAHQMVIFGGFGETLTLRHDSLDRKSMMPGVCLACRKVMRLDTLIYGLEHLL